MLQLLTAKPVLYVANVDEASAATGNALSAQVEKRAQTENAHAVAISAKIESELAMLPAEERGEYLESLGLKEPGLNRLIRAGYEVLGPGHLFHPSARKKRGRDDPQRFHRAAGGRRHSHRF